MNERPKESRKHGEIRLDQQRSLLDAELTSILTLIDQLRQDADLLVSKNSLPVERVSALFTNWTTAVISHNGLGMAAALTRNRTDATSRLTGVRRLMTSRRRRIESIIRELEQFVAELPLSQDRKNCAGTIMEIKSKLDTVENIAKEIGHLSAGVMM